MGKLQIHVQVETRDKNGKLISKTRKKLCHSYVLALIDMLRALMAASTANSKVTIKDTGNTNRDFNVPFLVNESSYFSLSCGAAAGEDTFAIQVGTDNTAITIIDNKLTVKVAHGTAPTELSYGSCSIGIPATVGASRQFTLARTFTNSSGADINVKEVGLILRAYYGSTVGYFMIEHSLLTFTVANGLSSTVTYTLSVTV